MSFLRTALILGRVSNLPTVWSNCLAGWWLGGAGNTYQLPWLFIGASLLYLGGMFLNDAFDVEFDRQHRRTRPIPSGAISAKAVWALGLVWIGLGEISLCLVGKKTGAYGLALVCAILLYDAVHKGVRFAPVLMGLCRLLLYLTAASLAAQHVTGWAIWSGLALGAYIVGLSYLARNESFEGQASRSIHVPPLLRYWPLLLLFAPIFLALMLNAAQFREGAFLLSVVLGLWCLRSLRATLWSSPPDIGVTVRGLLAGIVLVDWLAIVDAPRQFGFIFIALFLVAIFFQKFVPAT